MNTAQRLIACSLAILSISYFSSK